MSAQLNQARTDEAPLSVLTIDNFDSFTHNLVDDLRRLGATVETWRNDLPAERLLALAEALPAPRLIVISPGPGRPEDAGSCEALVRLASGRVPLFGVCLGLQVMVQALGGRVGPAGAVVHGKTAWIEHDGAAELGGLPSPLCVGRYHSLVATEVPACFEVSARYGQLVMALRHREHPTVGVQFHPESLLTPRGRQLLRGVTAEARRFYREQEPQR
jgi:anthranilate synthase component 2